MLNNVALDVAIGLIFIFLLYSLFATTIKEFIATIFSYRGKMLERGIEQMLDGKNYKYYWWDKLRNWFYNKDDKNPGKKLTEKKSLFAYRITSHELYKRAAETKMSDKPSYLAADNFSDILIDVLKGAVDGTILLKDIEQNVDQNLNQYPGLQKILKIYIEQANGDLQKFKLLIENWYNDMMDRVSGWYKKQANKILLIIGLFLAVIFNVSTIEIIDKLSTDKTARDALVQNATQYVKSRMDSVKTPQIKKENAIPKTTTDSSQANDTSKQKNNTSIFQPPIKATPSTNDKTVINADTDFTAIRAKVDSMKALYKSSIEENNNIIGLGWGDYGYTDDSLKWVKEGMAAACKPAYKKWYAKVGYILYESGTTPHKWLGFLITAFAISLGAPFWFDLLNKFINLRVSGTKPDDKSSTPVSKTALLNQKPDPTAKG